MPVNVTTEYECDGCGRTSDQKNFHTGFSCGNAYVSIKGSKGMKTAQGDWGGNSYGGDYFLCDVCGERVHDFIRTKLKEPE